MDEQRTAWWRRPRAKVSFSRLWAGGALVIATAFLVGLGVIVDDGRWRAKVLGGLVSALSFGIMLLVVVHLSRPVRTYDSIASADTDAMADWDAAMRTSGRVEVALSPLKVLLTFVGITAVLVVTGLMVLRSGDPVGVVIGLVVFIMFAFLGLVPHFQFVTGSKPAVQVDALGIQIARWGRLTIPWSAVQHVEVLQSTARQANVIIRVTPTFDAQDFAARPLILRLIEMPSRASSGDSYAIPSTTRANARTLAAWLAKEKLERRGTT
ncbi:hypothetical protein [Aeromicrobium ginsengisoli]|uniref:PH domain-containing protein n=1 Tax=Aeromicrobium ginsengisoli TaxID=363867 RepID=A0A5M4FI04_9ACTN|nr:hypothetical protein [Aeromicrobium ginsengisoli]KAA1399598.1 hypothetical protein ESP70_002200 [Aeromicrobium ginsengisoli]